MNQIFIRNSSVRRSGFLTAFTIGVILFGLTIYNVVRADPAFADAAHNVNLAIILLAAIALIISWGGLQPYSYYLALPSVYVVSWFLSSSFWLLFDIPTWVAGVSASLISAILVSLVHISSRDRYFFRSISISSFSKESTGFASAFFFLFGTIILNKNYATLTIASDPLSYVFTISFLYVTILVACIMFATSIVNTAWRFRFLCRTVGTKRLWKRLVEIFDDILEKKFPGQHENLNILGHCISGAVISFVEGDYEASFLSAYKVIREPSVVDPTEFVSDKRDRPPSSSQVAKESDSPVPLQKSSSGIDEEPPSFSDIRTVLMHFRRGHKPIKTARVEGIRRNLPKYCLEILERCFVFAGRVVRDERLDRGTSGGSEQPPSQNHQEGG